MKKIVCVLLLFTCLSQISIIAQNKFTLSGKVTDQHGAPLALATIAIENSSSGTYTDDNGRYSLKVSPGKRTLVISLVGYQTVKKHPGYSAGQSTQLHITRKCCYFELR